MYVDRGFVRCGRIPTFWRLGGVQEYILGAANGLGDYSGCGDRFLLKSRHRLGGGRAGVVAQGNREAGL